MTDGRDNGWYLPERSNDKPESDELLVGGRWPEGVYRDDPDEYRIRDLMRGIDYFMRQVDRRIGSRTW